MNQNIQPQYDWQSCASALTLEHRSKLAEWRGYAPKFVEWLHAENLVGLFDGERIAFPVHDAGRNVIGCHYRIKEDGSWRYHPTGTRTVPFVIGDPATAKTVFVFESQWDSLAVLDCLHHHIQPLADTAFIASRGAANARLLAGLCAPNALVHAFGQNDEAGQKWLAAVAATSGCKCVHVVTPSPYKDANDWTRTGANGTWPGHIRDRQISEAARNRIRRGGDRLHAFVFSIRNVHRSYGEVIRRSVCQTTDIHSRRPGGQHQRQTRDTGEAAGGFVNGVSLDEAVRLRVRPRQANHAIERLSHHIRWIWQERGGQPGNSRALRVESVHRADAERIPG